MVFETWPNSSATEQNRTFSEDKEKPKKYEAAKRYLNRMLKENEDYPVKSTEDKEECEELKVLIEKNLCNLDFGGEIEALGFIEGDIWVYHTNNPEKTKEGRQAIFEISNEFCTKNNFISAEKISEFFYEEYSNLIDEDMKDKGSYGKETDQWLKASNEIIQGSPHNALILIEERIGRLLEFIGYERRDQRAWIAKKKTDFIESSQSRLTEYSNKLSKYRKIRDSLYSQFSN